MAEQADKTESRDEKRPEYTQEQQAAMAALALVTKLMQSLDESNAAARGEKTNEKKTV